MKCNGIGCKEKEDFRREGDYRICNRCGNIVIVLRGGVEK